MLLKVLNYWKWVTFSYVWSVIFLPYVLILVLRAKTVFRPIQYCWFCNREHHQQRASTSVIRISHLPTPIQLWLLCLPRTVGHLLFAFHVGYLMVMIKQLSDTLSRFIYGPVSTTVFNSLAFQYILFFFSD